MMKEPDLEEEALSAMVEGGTLTITRRTLGEGGREVTVTAPDGTSTQLALTEISPGRHQATLAAGALGLYRISDGALERVTAVGPASPREFEAAIATSAPLEPVVMPTQGGFTRIEDGLPDVRTVREGRPAAGRGWIGIAPRHAYQTTDVRIAVLLPPWAFLLVAAGLTLAAWIREGRR
ncbi:MAG: hypothetical protein ACK4NE_02330 [Albidovulum sp.]